MEQVRKLVPVEVSSRDGATAGIFALILLSEKCRPGCAPPEDPHYPDDTLVQQISAAYEKHGADLLPTVFMPVKSDGVVPRYGDVVVAVRNTHVSATLQVRISYDGTDGDVFADSVAPGGTVFFAAEHICLHRVMRLHCEHPEHVQVAHGFVDNTVRSAIFDRCPYYCDDKRSESV